MKILIVEDEQLLADSLRTLLEHKGFTVEVAYDGESGMDLALLGIYDLLILDVMMPKLDGYELARRIRAQRCAARADRWTSCSMATPRWIWGAVCWSAGTNGSVSPPGNLTSCAF